MQTTEQKEAKKGIGKIRQPYYAAWGAPGGMPGGFLELVSGGEFPIGGAPNIVEVDWVLLKS